MAGVLWLTGDWIASQFTDDEAVRKQVSQYLTIVPISLVGYGIVTIASGCFNAINHPSKSLVFYLLRTAVLYVPLSFVASLFASAPWVYAAIGVANFLAGVVVAILSIRWLAKARCQPVPGVSEILESAFAQ